MSAKNEPNPLIWRVMQSDFLRGKKFQAAVAPGRRVTLEICDGSPRVDKRYVTRQARGMGVTNAERQKRWRTRRNELAQNNPKTIESALLQDVERCERGELSDQERIVLADKLADLAMHTMHRAQALAKMAQRVRYGREL